MNIIFDLDGTLIDSKLRLYTLFQQLVPISTLTFQQYWDFKHDQLSNQAILSREFRFEKNKITEFFKIWMNLIESPKLLALDSNFVGIHEALGKLKLIASLHVCTARQLRKPVLRQLTNLDLLQYFDTIMVTEQKQTKETLISEQVTNLSNHDWIIGDTGKDIQVGHILGIQTCAVLSGFMAKYVLLKYKPTCITESVTTLVVLVLT